MNNTSLFSVNGGFVSECSGDRSAWMTVAEREEFEAFCERVLARQAADAKEAEIIRLEARLAELKGGAK